MLDRPTFPRATDAAESVNKQDSSMSKLLWNINDTQGSNVALDVLSEFISPVDNDDQVS